MSAMQLILAMMFGQGEVIVIVIMVAILVFIIARRPRNKK
jgi:hypothetical protein